MTNSKSRKMFKFVTFLMAILMFSSVFTISASAASTTWTLTKDKTEAISTSLGLYKKGTISNLSNSTSSDDGVNLYLEYSIPGEGWVQAQHVFAELGYNASSGVYTVINNSKASWRGKMNSWWWGGKNCSATGKITAI